MATPSLTAMKPLSRQGHAAMSMSIKEDDQRWIQIQKNTFTNWVNEQLRTVNIFITDLQHDFCDGTKLIALIEVLQNRKIGKTIHNPINQHQMLENVQTALHAMAADNIKLVNIGNQDIVEGNLKLILGLVWTLILRYQIGKTKFPPKKLMLAWLQAVLPDLRIRNLTTDWNDGVALSALLDYCHPGLFPHWRNLDRHDRYNNCRNAMQLAQQTFGIPLVLSPEDFSSPDLDELSAMTYLSYFMKKDSPGFHSTLNWIKRAIPQANVRNFTTDWNNGKALCILVNSLGLDVPGWPNLSYDQSSWERNLQMGIDEGRRLGVEPILSAKEIAESEEEHLGIMAYTAWFQWIKPIARKRVSDKIAVNGDGLSTAHVNKTSQFQIRLLDNTVNTNSIHAELRGPSGNIPVNISFNRSGITGSYTPLESGPHQLYIFCDGEPVQGGAFKVKVAADLSKIVFGGIDHCALGSIVEVMINSNGAGYGEVIVEARSPTGRILKCPVLEQNGTYTATFTPNEVGEWTISITYDGEHIKGSPFTCQVYDASLVKVYGLEAGIIGQALTFTCDTTMAGWGDIKVDVLYSGHKIPVQIDKQGLYINRVTFTPTGAGTYKVHAYFNNIEIRGSPFTMDIIDGSAVSVSGDGLRLVPVGRPAYFSLNALGAGSGNIEIKITAPSRRNVPARVVQQHGDGTFHTEYTPIEVGEHLIEITFYQQHIYGSPFRCFAFDAKQIKVGVIPSGIVGKPVQFEIDGSSAGSGNLEILVNGGRVTSSVKSLGSQRFLASFIPLDPVTHIIEMKFNGESVAGSPWKCDIFDATRVTASGDGLRTFPVARTTFFNINTNGAGSGDLQVTITSASRRTVPFKLSDNSNSSFRCEFTPTEVGSHIVDVNFAGMKIAGAPFTGKCYDASKISVSDIPNGVVGQSCQFMVDASQAGEGQLEISINNGQVPNNVQVLGSGRCLISFVPHEPIIHVIDIRFNGEIISGSPFKCHLLDVAKVTVSTNGLQMAPVGRPVSFEINTQKSGEAECEVTVLSPSHHKLPVQLTRLPAFGFRTEFTPTEIGLHLITVNYCKVPIIGSPFHCKAYDSRQVKVGEIPKGNVNKPLSFIVDASQAGEGSAEITVSTQNRKIPSQVEQIGNAKFSLSFIPVEPSPHLVNVTFNNEPVPGSPFRADISDVGKVSVSGEGISMAKVGQTSQFVINTQESGQGNIDVNIEGPGNKYVPARVTDNQNHTFNVEFTPQLTGDHKINILFQSSAISGSPFICRVYDVKNIKVGDIPSASIGQPVTFTVDASQAGTGNLEVSVNNGRIPTSAQSLGNNRYSISFVPRTSEKHLIELKFNGELVPGSPFHCNMVDSSLVTITGEGLDKVSVNKLVTLNIDSRNTGEAECSVTVTGPGRPVPVHITGNASTMFKAEYTLTEVGDYLVDVRYGNKSVAGSPFSCRAYDVKKIRVSEVGNGVVGKPVGFHIDASQAGAGNLEIIVSVNGRNVPNFVRAEDNAHFKVSFTPQEAAVHNISVKFNNEPVAGSTFVCNVMDGSHVIAQGDGLHTAAVSKAAWFEIDPRGTGEANMHVSVSSPTGHSLPIKLTGHAHTKYRVEFTPVEVGDHSITVIYAETAIAGSPFTSRVFDVNKVQVSKIGPGAVGNPVKFHVDTSKAGDGQLSVEVTSHSSTLNCDLTTQQKHSYDCSFIPQDTSTHYVSIKYNQVLLPGSPFHCDIIDGSRCVAHGDGLKFVSVGQLARFEVDPRGAKEAEVDVKVSSPSGIKIPCKVVITPLGIYRAEYTPLEVGPHKVVVTYAQTLITGSPFTCEVYDYTRVKVTENDDGVVGRESILKVDSSSAGAGIVTADIKCNGRDVTHSIRNQGNGIHQIMYTPRESSVHLIEVIFNGFVVPGGPYVANIRDPGKVSASGKGLKMARMDEPTFFVVELHGNAGSSGDVDVVITAPNGSAMPVKCYQQKDKDYKAEFVPRMIGTHKIEVTFAEQNIVGSPFMCEVFNPHQVFVQDNLPRPMIGEDCEIEVEHQEAGKGEVTAIITSPKGRSITADIRNLGSKSRIRFRGLEIGKHKLAVAYNGEAIPKSPLTFLIDDSGIATAYGEGLVRGQEDEAAKFVVDGKGLRGELHVQVDGPNSIAKVNIEPCGDGTYNVTYVPAEVGLFTIKITWNSRVIPGSPFHPKIVDPRKVKVIGGLVDSNNRIQLKVNEEKIIILEPVNAGPGSLTSEVQGPRGLIPVNVNYNENKYKVVFTPYLAGDHFIHLFWANVPLPKSPFLGYAEPSHIPIDYTKVELKGHGLTEAQPKEESEFIIDGSNAGPGLPTVTLTGVKNDIPVAITPQGNNIYKVTYTPTTGGSYLLNVMWSERQVKGCPYKLNIVSHSDSSKVAVSGEGIRTGILGREIKSFIDTRRAGPGELTASCMGPHKSAYCELYDHRDGTFTLNIKPQEAGRHVLTVKYGGEHVPGSPFVLRIASAPDASKVKVYGPGIEHGVLSNFQSRFICETRGAGAGQLSVRIRGPKGAFRVEMQRESQKDRTILCKYDPTEPGDYRIEVKWSGEHVPGSPFIIMIFDVQEELSRFLSGETIIPGKNNVVSTNYTSDITTFTTTTLSSTMTSTSSYEKWKKTSSAEI